MNRRAFFSALAGAPVVVMAGTSVASPEPVWPITPKWKLDDPHHRYAAPYVDQMKKCECGSPMFYDTGKRHLISSRYGLETYSAPQACVWCGKEWEPSER